jgi:hypothetical protein
MTSQLDTSEHMTLWKGCADQDNHAFYAVVLLPGLDVEPVPFFAGATTRQELVTKVQERYGPDALHVVPYRFNRALQRRKTHRQGMIELLSQYHLEGDELRAYVVYGSSLRPLSTNDIRSLAPYGAISITAHKEQDGYYSYIVASQFLPEEQENAYELEFISRPLVMKSEA